MCKVAVVILNWRGYRDTIACIESVCMSGINKDDIIVVDNDSRDESVVEIRNSFADIEIVESGKNGGFAYGCNVGIQLAIGRGYQYIWLLNNDTIINPSTLPEMLVKFQDPAVGIIGSTIRDIDFPYEIQTVGGGSVSFIDGTTKNIKSIGEMRKNLMYITGASMLISSKLIEKIGLFKEEYFMYWEDVEFCFRARKNGFKIDVAINSTVLHKESASSNPNSVSKLTMGLRSQKIFFGENARFPYLTLGVYRLGKTVKMLIRGESSRIKYLWL